MGKFITVFENRCDEPFRTFTDGCCGAIRTNVAGGDKYILELADCSNPKDYSNSRCLENYSKNMKVNYVLIPQWIKIRKYPVDENKLKEVLHKNKKLSNKEIAKKLNVSTTTVEHWFRKDSYFCIPDSENWKSLKTLLGITTDIFDKSIETFEERLGTFEKAERCYLTNGLAACLLTSGVDTIIVYEL